MLSHCSREKTENGRLFATERNRFSSGDVLELIEPGRPPRSFAVRDLRDGEGNAIDCANHPLMPVSMAFAEQASVGAFLRRKKQ